MSDTTIDVRLEPVHGGPALDLSLLHGRVRAVEAIRGDRRVQIGEARGFRLEPAPGDGLHLVCTVTVDDDAAHGLTEFYAGAHRILGRHRPAAEAAEPDTTNHEPEITNPEPAADGPATESEA